MLLSSLLLGVLLPAGTSAALLALGPLPWQRRRAVGGRVARGTAAVGLGYLAGHLALLGWPPFPPLEAKDWLPWLALAAVAWGFLATLPALPRLALALSAALLAVSAVALVLHPVAGYYEWSRGVELLLVAGLAGALLLFWWMLDVAAAESPGARFPLAGLPAPVGASLALLLSGSALLGQLSGVLAASLGPLLLLAWFRPDSRFHGGATAAFLLLHASLLLNGALYLEEMPAAAVVLLWIAPAAALLPRLPALRRLSSPRATLLALLMAATLSVAAVLLCLGGSAPSPYTY